MNDTSAIQPGLFDSDDGALSLETKGHSAEELFRLLHSLSQSLFRRYIKSFQGRRKQLMQLVL